MTAFRWVLLVVTLAAGASAQEDPKVLRKENSQFTDDIIRLKYSCADLAELERIAATVGPTTAQMYLDKVKHRRAEKLAPVKAEMQRVSRDEISKWNTTFFADADRPDGTRDDVAELSPAQVFLALRAELDAARCYDADFVTKALAALDDLKVSVDKMIAAESACRSAPACISKRLVTTTCAWIAARKSDLAMIAEEKKNPGGVVDLAKLHGLGQEVQTIDGQIAQSKKAYVAAAKKPFSEALCPK
jgi:hypothetical protein